VNSTIRTQKKPMLRDRTHRGWSSRLFRHQARKQRSSILSTMITQGGRVPEPARGQESRNCLWDSLNCHDMLY